MEEKGFRGTGHETKALVRCLLTWRNTKRMASEEVVLEEGWSGVHRRGNRKNKALENVVLKYNPSFPWRWKQSPMPSAGLPQEVAAHMPPSSQIQ